CLPSRYCLLSPLSKGLSNLLPSGIRMKARKKGEVLCQKSAQQPRAGAGTDRRGLVNQNPALAYQHFQRPVFGLVVHLAAVTDPVPEIDRWQAGASGLVDLPEDGVAAQAATRLLRIEEGIDR